MNDAVKARTTTREHTSIASKSKWWTRLNSRKSAVCALKRPVLEIYNGAQLSDTMKPETWVDIGYS